jgi:alginate O-acetyltransferase complex protein AlgI
MLFSSPIFMFLFLPVVLAFYYVLRGTAVRNALLVVASLFFYSWGEPWQCWLIVCSIIANYFLAIGVDKTEGLARRWVLGFGVAVNIAILCWFKYADFFIANVNGALVAAHLTPLSMPHPQLPLGISFFTFHSISYLIDVYRKTSKAQRDPMIMALYISLFPQLLAGPIIRYKDISKQFTERRESLNYFHQGVQRFVNGLAKKILIANTVAVTVDKIYALPPSELSTGLAWLAALGFTLQIYFDFSGYSDMAIGLALMFGFRFPENFNFPYIATSIRDFWRRWHISLSTWFRDYVYLPLGGNRVGTGRSYFNLVLIFFLCGLWHGASWKFVVWGLYHGIFLVLERTKVGSFLEQMPKFAKHIYVLLACIVGWVLFRAEDMAQACNVLSCMFSLRVNAAYPIEMFLTPDVLCMMVIGTLFSFPTAKAVVRLLGTNSGGNLVPVRMMRTAWVAVMLVLCISESYAMDYRPFLYFRF